MKLHHRVAGFDGIVRVDLNFVVALRAREWSDNGESQRENDSLKDSMQFHHALDVCGDRNGYRHVSSMRMRLVVNLDQLANRCVCIFLRGRQRLMAQELLNCSEISAIRQ